jgi:hypothetical protein
MKINNICKILHLHMSASAALPPGISPNTRENKMRFAILNLELKGNIDILRDFDDGLEVTASRFFK